MAAQKEKISKKVTQAQARAALRALQHSKNGRDFTDWLMGRLKFSEPLAALDARVQERNVALHDFSVELVNMLNNEEG